MKMLHCFNTSHVVVYPNGMQKGNLSAIRFNTSHVVVYPETAKQEKTISERFNTSHVVVYPECITNNTNAL